MSTMTARLPARRAPVVVAKVRVVAQDEAVHERLTCSSMVPLKGLYQANQGRPPALVKMVSLQ